MSRLAKCVFLAVVFLAFISAVGSGQANTTSLWTFAVSGDSRNCGDVIMPAIAAGTKDHAAAFYWHLGDLRATTFIDEDYLHEPEHNPAPDKSYYNKTEWDDFIQSQLNPFGSIPVFVGIGNHETYAPLNREQFLAKFAPWLDAPPLHRQRLADNPNDHALKTYFHWIENGVDFVYLDNSTHDQFDAAQMAWFEGLLERAAANKDVKSVVVGMHAALPDSLASGHSMNDWDIGAQSGRRVYTDLQNFLQKTHKHVYILSSHSHFFMAGIFDSDYWREHGGALPGWIVGTAGAVRYRLPATASRAKEARQKIYGYLLGSVRKDGSIDFSFKEIRRENIPAAVSQRYSAAFVDYCFEKNTDFRTAAATAGQKLARK